MQSCNLDITLNSLLSINQGNRLSALSRYLQDELRAETARLVGDGGVDNGGQRGQRTTLLVALEGHDTVSTHGVGHEHDALVLVHAEAHHARADTATRDLALEVDPGLAVLVLEGEEGDIVGLVAGETVCDVDVSLVVRHRQLASRSRRSVGGRESRAVRALALDGSQLQGVVGLLVDLVQLN